MALKDILVGVDPSTAGEGRLKLALNLVRAHRAHITACYVMREEHGAPVSPILPGVPVNPGPGVLVAPEARTTVGDPTLARLHRYRAKPSAPSRSKSSSGPNCGPTARRRMAPSLAGRDRGLYRSCEVFRSDHPRPAVAGDPVDRVSPGRNRHCDGSAGSDGPVCRHLRYGRQARARRLGRDAGGGARSKRRAAAARTGRGSHRDVCRRTRGGPGGATSLDRTDGPSSSAARHSCPNRRNLAG